MTDVVLKLGVYESIYLFELTPIGKRNVDDLEASVAKKGDLFVNENETKVTISFKAPESLKKRIDDINKRLANSGTGKVFTVQKLLLKELEDMVEMAEQELESVAPKAPESQPVQGSVANNLGEPQASVALAG